MVSETPAAPQMSDIAAEIRRLEAHSEHVLEEMQNGRRAIDQARNLLVYLQAALDASVKLQSHYAQLLNMHDGGQRLTFADADAWLARLAAVGGVARGTSQSSQT